MSMIETLQAELASLQTQLDTLDAEFIALSKGEQKPAEKPVLARINELIAAGAKKFKEKQDKQKALPVLKEFAAECAEVQTTHETAILAEHLMRQVDSLKDRVTQLTF